MNLLTKSKPQGRDIVALQEGVLDYVGFAAYRLEGASNCRWPLATRSCAWCCWPGTSVSAARHQDRGL